MKKVTLVSLFILGLVTALGSTWAAPAQEHTQGTKSSEQDKTMPSQESDRTEIAQLALNYPPLQAYYHVNDAPGRKPLIIVKNTVLSEALKLTQFGESVRFMMKAEAVNKPYLEFTKFTVGADSAQVELEYPIEGIFVSLVFERRGGQWVVQSGSLKER